MGERRRRHRSLAARVDRFMQIAKWPVAAIAVASLPGAIWSVVRLVQRVGSDPGPLLPFLLGLLAYLLLWFLILRRPTMGSFLSTFEHEITHAIFAWLTFHRVVGLRTSWSGGGEISFRGRGNWLIMVAPYFFPTISVAVAVALALVPTSWLGTAASLLGVTVAYHITSTWIETHRDQPDLHRVGLPFAFLFLPTANLLSYGLLVAFAYGGLGEIGRLFNAVGQGTLGWWGGLLGLFV